MIRRGAVVPRPLYFNLGNPPLLLLPRRPQFQMRNYPFFGINGRPMYRVRSSIGPDGNGIANRFCPVSHFQRNRLVASGVYLAFAFSSRRLLYIDSYSRFLYRVDRERKDVSIVRKRYFFFFYEYLFFFTYYFIGIDGNCGIQDGKMLCARCFQQVRESVDRKFAVETVVETLHRDCTDRDRGIQTFGFTLGRLNDALQGLRALRR